MSIWSFISPSRGMALFVTIRDLACIFQRERGEPEVFGGRGEVPGGALQDRDPGAAAGEDKIRFKVRTVQATRVELVCQGWVTAWCNSVKQIFILVLFFECSDSSISPLSVSLVAVTTLSLRSGVPQHQGGRSLWATGTVHRQTEQTVQQVRWHS